MLPLPFRRRPRRPGSRARRVAGTVALAALALTGLSSLFTMTPTGAVYTSTATSSGDFNTRVACSAGTGYPAGVVALGPSFYYRFPEANAPYPGTTADSSGNGNTGTVVAGVPATNSLAFGATSPLWCDTGAVSSPAVDRPTVSAGFAVWDSLRAQPNVFTLMAWVKTPAGMATGGQLMGFGNSDTAMSSQYDRHLYLDNAGHVVFGIWTGAATTISSPGIITDGSSHQIAASLGPAGGRLYIDGVMVASDATWTTAEAYNGYWRVGWDNLNAWGTATDPADFGLNGVIDEAAVFEGKQLTPTEIAGTYALNHW